MYSRHDLVWLTPHGWRAAAESAPAPDRDAIELWRREDWPAIVRRHDAGAPAGTVSLGIALPPDPADGSKRRIAIRAPGSHVARRTPPLPLAETLAAAPAHWHQGLAALDANAPGPGLRAYGSLALQALTGRQYLTASSDIDLLFGPATVGQLDAGIALLSAHVATLPLDGEIVFPCGDAVAWKEWRGARENGARVLVKSIGAVRLADPAALIAALEAP
ncbi:MAG: malonate decarboxylase holo-[acyl-carrier-protein] synthase [Massilia sp.]